MASNLVMDNPGWVIIGAIILTVIYSLVGRT